jgi:hypothetical protein
LQALREIVNDLLEKGVVKKSFSQYASPAFLVPKPQGGYRMVIDYRLLNKKVVFDAFPMPSVEHAFAYAYALDCAATVTGIKKLNKVKW